MTARTYDDLLDLVQGLCGVQFSAIELPRIVAMMNRRAAKAYRYSDLWARYLVVGEERTVSSSVIPYTQSGLDNIGMFLRIHRTEPFVAASAQEFAFHVASDGAHLISGDLDPSSAFVTYKIAYTPAINSTSDDIPGEWFYYIGYGTYADWLRAEGQQEKAVIADQEAAAELDEELTQPQYVAIANTIFNHIHTNTNMQNR